MKTLILGLGNPILSDDGIGVKIAEAVRVALEPVVPVIAGIEYGRRGEWEAAKKHIDSVTISEASVGGLRLMETMVGYDRVILIDALYHPDVRAGTVERMTLDDLKRISATQHSASAHDTSLITALDVGQRLGLPLPREIIIYAIGVRNILDFGEDLTPAVERIIPKVTAAVLSEL